MEETAHRGAPTEGRGRGGPRPRGPVGEGRRAPRRSATRGFRPPAPGWTYDAADIARHQALLCNRVVKRLRALRAQMAAQGVNAFRLYDWDIPEVRAVVDYYDGRLVVGEYVRTQTVGVPWLETMADGLAEALDIAKADIHLRRRQTRPESGPRYERLDAQRIEHVVAEGPLRFLVNLSDYLDTGLFLHHRKTRRMLAKEAQGKKLLNLFGYTGSMAVAAGCGGAVRTVSVDASKTYIEWAGRNLELNQLTQDVHGLVRADVDRYLSESPERFDIVFLDPPSFSTRFGEGDLDVQRDQRRLIERNLERLQPDGVLYFAPHHGRFEPNFAGLPVRSIRELTRESTPADFQRRPLHRLFRMQK